MVYRGLPKVRELIPRVTAGQKFLGKDILLRRAREMNCKILLNQTNGRLAILVRGLLFEFEDRKRIASFLGWAKKWKAATPTKLPRWVRRVAIPIALNHEPEKQSASLVERAAMDRGPIRFTLGVSGGQSLVPGHYVELDWYDLPRRGA